MPGKEEKTYNQKTGGVSLLDTKVGEHWPTSDRRRAHLNCDLNEMHRESATKSPARAGTERV